MDQTQKDQLKTEILEELKKDIFNSEKQKAFDFSSDYTKLLMTLATAAITFMVTFLSDVFSKDFMTQKLLLVLSWLTFLLSIGCGMLKLMALTGNLDPIQPKSGTKAPILTITSFNVRLWALSQIILFMGGIFLTGLFGYHRIYSNLSGQKEMKDKTEKQNTVIIIRETILGRDTIKTKDTCYLEKK